MITEFAQIDIKPGLEDTFIAGVEASRPLFLAAKGCHAVALHHCIEEPARFLLMVQWDTVEDHMVHFRQSADYQSWRGHVGHCFAAPPTVWHGQTVA